MDPILNDGLKRRISRDYYRHWSEYKSEADKYSKYKKYT